MAANKPVVLAILDGWGIAPASASNAVSVARTPNMDHWTADYPATTLVAHNGLVGLPEGQMGNSEVGHLNIGAGRVVYQDLVKINMAVKDGSIRPAPVAMLVGYKIFAVDKGYAVFELNPAEYHYNPFATVHGGILTTLLDTTMTASVLSTLPQGMTCSTVEIKTNFIRPVTEKSGLLRCEARPIHLGKRLATVQGRLKDGQERLVAHGTSTCSLFKVSIT